MVEKVAHRFDTRLGCRCNCIDALYSFWQLTPPSKKRVESAKGTFAICRLLEKSGFRVRLSVQKHILFSPLFWPALWKRAISHSTLISQCKKRLEKNAFLIHGTCQQLYKIDEDWTHYIAIFRDLKYTKVVDPYKCQFEQDFPEVEYPDFDSDSNWLHSSIIFNISRP